MAYSFGKLFEQLLKEIDVKNIGVFPGKFKPPHRGHFETCKVAAAENDMVAVLISNKPHEGISAEQSFNIWNIYKKYIPNIIPFISTPTPVLACYDLANILNNGVYKPSPASSSPKSNVNDLVSNSREIESYINVGNSIILNLYSSPEDQARFKNIQKEPYVGNSILKIEYRPVNRLTSASEFRKAIMSNRDVDSFLPSEIKQDDRIKIKNIINEAV